MLAGLRFVRQGERARLEIGNLGRFALHAATRRVAALGMGDGADLGAIYEAACFLQSQCCTARYCACSEAALFCALQVYQPPPEGCQAPDLRRVFVETAIPEAATVVCASCQTARDSHAAAGAPPDCHPDVVRRWHGLDVLSTGIWQCGRHAVRQGPSQSWRGVTDQEQAAIEEAAGLVAADTLAGAQGLHADGADRHQEALWAVRDRVLVRVQQDNGCSDPGQVVLRASAANDRRTVRLATCVRDRRAQGRPRVVQVAAADALEGPGCMDVTEPYLCIVCGESGIALCGNLQCTGAYCREHLE